MTDGPIPYTEMAHSPRKKENNAKNKVLINVHLR